MDNPRRSPALVLSIDWDPRSEKSFTRRQRDQQWAGKLVQMLQRYQLAATWALPRPGHGLVTGLLQTGSTAQEIALLADRSWAHHGVSRRQFAETLEKRLESAERQGVRIRSLALPNCQSASHLDLIVKQEMTALRAGDQRNGRKANGQPHALRFGLWNIPASGSFPNLQHWLWGAGSYAKTQQGIRRSMQLGLTTHLVIDGERLEETASADLRSLEKILRHASDAQGRGTLRVETMSQLVSRKMQPRRSEPAQSILRRAA